MIVLTPQLIAPFAALLPGLAALLGVPSQAASIDLFRGCGGPPHGLRPCIRCC